MLHEDQQALVEIQQSDLQKFPLFHSVAAVIYAESGMTAEANREGELLLKMRPDFLSRVDAEIDKRIARPEDRARLIAGLIKAGLQPAPTSATAPAPASPLQR
jgi:adenylate cyclase